MKKDKKYTNFYLPAQGKDLIFIEGVPEIPERTEAEYIDEDNEHQINLIYSHYDFNKQTKEWLEIIDQAGVSNYSFSDWLCEILQNEELQVMNDSKESSYNDLQEAEQSCIFDCIYLQKSIEESSQNNSVCKSQVKKWIKNFKSRLQLRNITNRRFLNKSRLLEQEHKDYLFSLWSTQFAKPYTLNELSIKLSDTFKEQPKVSASTISRALRNDLQMSYRKLWKITPKYKEKHEVSKLAKSAILLKRLEEENIELIFIDELSVSERSYKPYGWRLKGK